MTEAGPDVLEIDLLDGELWWGGAVADGQQMPFGGRAHRRDLATSAGHPGGSGEPEGGANQSAPLMTSNRGRSVWSEQPFTFAFDGAGRLRVSGVGLVLDQAAEATLGAAFRNAAGRHFPAAGQTPATAMLAAPQYNTWIELPYLPTQDGVLGYVRQLLDAGFPPGVVMIDDRWSRDYGDWRFEVSQFPDPRAMTEVLHSWGCAVMLWLVPFVSPDSATFRALDHAGCLIRRPDGRPVVRQWWNGYSAIVDLTKPEGEAWLRSQLDDLAHTYGIDGFKFDAGDLRDYRVDDVSHGGGGPVAQTEAYARLGADYPYNEFRACWKMGGQPLAQRLHDKPPVWGDGGLASLIPEGIAQSLIGHPYTCPDMIGGGDLAAITESVDQELFVRYAQLAALFPMMQFSAAPQHRLDKRHLAAVKAAVDLHQDLVPTILALAEAAARTGEPILRPLAYHHPGYDQVVDEFLLGPDVLCAPVLEAGATSRRVVVPPGRWTGADGTILTGPTTTTVPVDLDTVPWWRRLTD